jgi:hypothetical protein
VRLTFKGVPVREGGLLGRLMVGLSQDEKKSSPGSPEGVLVSLSDSFRISVMTTSSGYLAESISTLLSTAETRLAYCLASAALRLDSSSLYFTAAFEVYFVFGSLLANAADPPWVWKYFVADSFPPTFMIRSWSHCQTINIQLE